MDKKTTDKAAEKPKLELFSVELMPATVQEDSRTIDCVFYTGATVPRMDYWTGERYMLTLAMGKECDLGRLNGGAPLLDSHQNYSTENQIGVVERAWIENGTGHATVRFSKRPAVEPIWTDVKDGILRNVSMGAAINKLKDVTKEDEKLKSYMAVDWQPFEISIVPVPADAGAGFLSHQQIVTDLLGEATNRAAAHEGVTMTEQPTTAAGASLTDQPRETELNTQAINADAIRAEAGKAERFRITEITRLTKAARLEEAVALKLIDDGVTLDAARTAILEKLAAKSAVDEPQSQHAAGVRLTRDAYETQRECLQAGLEVRINPRVGGEIAAKGRDYAGLTLFEMARECLELQGVKTRGLSREKVARVALQGRMGESEYFDMTGAHTTSDFPNILANVANKSLRMAYEAAPRTFVPFTRQVSAPDFKTINRVQLSDAPTLTAINEKGEYHRVGLSDSKESYSLATYGEIIAITRKVIINDDLNALSRVPAALGVAAATLESDTVWGIVTANAALADTVALFHATHKNLSTSNGLAAIANITTARTLLRKQTGPKGTILNLIPKYLIVPAALEGIAFQLTNPMNLAATVVTADVPAFIRTMVPIVEPRLDAVASVGATNWYTAADPSTIDTIEYCYLEGQQGVYIETRQGFDVDGFEIKARLDFAAAAIDFRGLQKNTA